MSQKTKPYKIKKLQFEKAKELGVTIRPSTNLNKKIDVFIGLKKVASIGANKSINPAKPMMDYATYLQKGDKSLAEQRRTNYINRHSKEPKVDDDGDATKSFYDDEILWGKRGENVNRKGVAELRKDVLKAKKEEAKSKPPKKKK